MIVVATLGARWDGPEPSLVARVLRREGEGPWVELERLDLAPSPEPAAPTLRLSPDGRHALVLGEAGWRLYAGADLALSASEPPERGVEGEALAAFSRDGRWLLLRPPRRRELVLVDVEARVARALGTLPSADPASLAPEKVNTFILLHRSKAVLVGPEVAGALEERLWGAPHPVLELACTGAGERVILTEEGLWSWRPEGPQPLRRLSLDGVAEARALLALEDDVAVAWHAPGRGLGLACLSGAQARLEVDEAPAAMRWAAGGEALWVARGTGLERHAVAWTPPPSRAGWEALCERLDGLEGAPLRRALESLDLRAWPEGLRLPPARWAPGDPRLASCALRPLAELGEPGRAAVVSRPGGGWLALVCGEREARLLELVEGRKRLLATARASGKGLTLAPGGLAVSDGGRVVVAHLSHVAPWGLVQPGQVPPPGGGEQLLVLVEGRVVAHLRDTFVPVPPDDDRRHGAFALAPDGRALFWWSLGGGQLTRMALPGGDFERALPWPRAADLSLSPDGRLLAVAGSPRAHLLDARTLEPLLALHAGGAPCPARRVAFDAEGQHIALVDLPVAPEGGPLRLRWLRLSDGGRAARPLLDLPLAVPEGEPPAVSLGPGPEGLRLLWSVQGVGVGVVELPSLRASRLDLDLQGQPTCSADGRDVLLGLDGRLLAWRP